MILTFFDGVAIFLITTAGGWLSASILSYFQKKGENLATKEDIEEITEKIESVKNSYEKQYLKSSALIERQISAFDEIIKELNEIQHYCFRKYQDSEHAVPYEKLSDKSTFQRAIHLREVSDRHRVFISKQVFGAIVSVSHKVFDLGHAELHAEQNEPIDKKLYEEVRLEAKSVAGKMREELFDAE